MECLEKIASLAIASMASGSFGLKKQAVTFSPDKTTFTLDKGETPSHVTSAYNKTSPATPITTTGVLNANKGVKPNKFKAGVKYYTGIAPVVSPATTAPQAAPPPKPFPSVPVSTNAVQAVAPATGPVGFRNNNPGNLRSDGKTKWQGATSVPENGEWLKFNTWDDGVRAMARTLYNYGKKHKIDTLEGALKRYDRSPDQTKYLNHVRRKMGLQPNQKIDLTDVNTLHKLVPAMGSFEIGPKYWGTYDTTSVSNAVQRAIPPTVITK